MQTTDLACATPEQACRPSRRQLPLLRPARACAAQYQLNQRLVAAARAELPLYGPSKDFSYDARWAC